MTYRETKRASAAIGLLATILTLALGSPAAAQEGTGDPAFILRFDEIQRAYPPAALAKGLNGEAVVTCQLSGSAIRDCAVTSETPAGEGFGPAALALVSRYQVDRPVNIKADWPRVITIPFTALKPHVVHAGGTEYTTPFQLEGPSADALYAAWPRAARFVGLEGAADLRCTVALDGRLKDCVVGTVQGASDMGPAALSLAPLYRFQPGRRNGAPVAMSTLVTVSFACDYRCRRFEGPAVRPRQVWEAAPTPAQVLAAWPAAARARGVEGAVRLICQPDMAGKLAGCRVAAESTPGEGFGDAALGLVDAFRLPPIATPPAPTTPRGGIGAALMGVRPPLSPVVTPQPVALMIAFGAAGGRPRWTYGRTLAGVLAADGQSTVRGQARARCRVAADGRLEACDLASVEPADPAVEREARRALDGVVAQLWTEEGRSTVGAAVLVDVPVGQSSPSRIVFDEPPPTPRGVIVYQPLVRRSDIKPEDAARYYPDRAQRTEVSGRSLLSCSRLVNGAPDGCVVLSETPPEYGFGDAALKMSRFFHFEPETIDGVPTDEAILIPMTFKAPL